MSYGYTNTVNETISQLVSDDFDGSGFEVSDVEGTLTVTARISPSLPDGWDFAGYTDSIEIEKAVSF